MECCYDLEPDEHCSKLWKRVPKVIPDVESKGVLCDGSEFHDGISEHRDEAKPLIAPERLIISSEYPEEIHFPQISPV